MEDAGEVVARADPHGVAIFEPGGRAMFIMTVSGRSPPGSEAEAAAL